MSARVLHFPAPRAADPIRVMDPEPKYAPAPCIIGFLLCSIGLWWLAWAIWRLI